MQLHSQVQNNNKIPFSFVLIPWVGLWIGERKLCGTHGMLSEMTRIAGSILCTVVCVYLISLLSLKETWVFQTNSPIQSHAKHLFDDVFNVSEGEIDNAVLCFIFQPQGRMQNMSVQSIHSMPKNPTWENYKTDNTRKRVSFTYTSIQ